MQTTQICIIVRNYLMMNPSINLLSVIPIRKEPAHRSEMVSQLLFGEYVLCGAEENDFTHVTCLYDQYTGWVQSTQLHKVDDMRHTDQFVASWEGIVLLNGRPRPVPMCSPMFAEKLMVGKTEVICKPGEGDHWDGIGNRMNAERLRLIYEPFLDTPYLWGGKSVFGIDCSGFVQQVFKMFGIKLLRDAYLQAGQGEAVESLKDARTGDLAFFHNEKGRITHVGLLLSDRQIIHASGKVKIDTIDRHGIMDEQAKRTHHLHSIRRFLD
jgi:hypothetical protein